MTTMPERLIPYALDIVMSAFTLTIFIASMSFITLIVGLLSGIFWVARIKGLIEKHHDGNVLEWLKWLVKKNK